MRFGLKRTLRCVIWVKSWKLEALIWVGSGVKQKRPWGDASVTARGARGSSNIQHRADAPSFYPDSGDNGFKLFRHTRLIFIIGHLLLFPGLTLRPSKVQVKFTLSPLRLPESLNNRKGQDLFAVLVIVAKKSPWKVFNDCHLQVKRLQPPVFTETWKVFL